MNTQRVPREDAVRNIVVSLLLTIITCWLYNIYWNAKEMKTFNGLLERDEFSFWTWLIVSILTCGLFHVYYEYKMGVALIEIQEKYGLRIDNNLSLISLILTLFGLSIVVDAIQQNEINKVYEKLYQTA